jgi:drug/metabolite transporter (DMT)-like permease
MPFPSFFSSLIIASSTFIVLLFAVLTFVAENNYKSKWVINLLMISISLISFTNILTIIAFYQLEPITDTKAVYPLVTYILGIIAFLLGGFCLVLEKYAKISS